MKQVDGPQLPNPLEALATHGTHLQHQKIWNKQKQPDIWSTMGWSQPLPSSWTALITRHLQQVRHKSWFQPDGFLRFLAILVTPKTKMVPRHGWFCHHFSWEICFQAKVMNKIIGKELSTMRPLTIHCPIQRYNYIHLKEVRSAMISFIWWTLQDFASKTQMGVRSGWRSYANPNSD